MRVIKYKLVKGNKLQGIVELLPNGIISPAYVWDTAYQFTGLLDKQGKEICEGDIVKSKYGIFKVVWEDKYACYNLVSLDKSASLKEIPAHNIPQSEYIGNIYENPELLEVK